MYELRNASCILTFSSIEYSNGSDVYLYSLADYANRELIRGLLEQG